MKHAEAFVYSSCHFLSSHRDAYGIVITSNGVAEYENVRTFEATDYCAMDLLGLIDALEHSRPYSQITLYTARSVVDTLRNRVIMEKWKRMGFRHVILGELWRAVTNRKFDGAMLKYSEQVSDNINYLRAQQIAAACLLPTYENISDWKGCYEKETNFR